MPLAAQNPVNHTLSQDVDEIWAEWVLKYFDGTHTYGAAGLDGAAADERDIPECELLLGQDRPENTEGLAIVQLIFDDSLPQVRCWEEKKDRRTKTTLWTMNVLVQVPVRGGRGEDKPAWRARWIASVLREMLEDEAGVPRTDLAWAGISQVRVKGHHAVPGAGYSMRQVLVTFQTRT